MTVREAEATFTLSYLHQHAEERFPVFSPDGGQLISSREQTAAGVDCDLRAVTKVYAEVLQWEHRRVSGTLETPEVHMPGPGARTFMLPM